MSTVTTASDFYALARIGPHLVGVAQDWVERALPLRGGLFRAPPRRQGALAGMAQSPAGLIPVAELSRWLDIPAEATATGRDAAILVLKQGDRRIGLQVQSLAGVRRIEPAQIRRLHHDAHAEELFEAVAAPGADQPEPIHLLEPERLMALMRSWNEEASDDMTSASDDPITATAGRGAPCALLRAAGQWLAVPARYAGELVPMPVLSQRWQLAGLTRGLAHWRGRPVAMLDPQRVLGLEGSGNGSQERWALLLSDAQRALLLPVEEFAGLSHLPATLAAPADDPATGAAPRQRWLDALLGQIELLDASALLQRVPEAALAGSGEAKTGAPAGAPSAATGRAGEQLNEQAYMVFESDAPYALPVADVQAVLPGDPAMADRELVDWRGRQLPLRHLAGPARSAPPMVLVLGRGERLHARAIRRLIALVPARAGQLSALPGAPGQRMLTLQQPRASYTVLQALDA